METKLKCSNNNMLDKIKLPELPQGQELKTAWKDNNAIMVIAESKSKVYFHCWDGMSKTYSWSYAFGKAHYE